MTKRLSTTLAATALAVTGLSVPAASAASAAMPDSDATANTGRTSARIYNHGMNCYGKAVRRCIWVQHDRTHHAFRAYAGIRDKRGGHAWWVKVTNVHLTRDNIDNQFGKTADDYDGWHAYTDHARGYWWHCPYAGSGPYDLDALAHFSWKGHSNGGFSWWSKTVHITC